MPKTRWAQIEPNNLLAWLPDFQDTPPLTDVQWQGVGAARYVRDYQYELQARLLALLAKTPPGLELEMGLELVRLNDLKASTGPSLHTLQKQCAKPEAASRHRGTCLHAASLFWNAPQPSLFGRATAFVLSMELNALGDPDWVARFAELQAISPELLAAFQQVEYEPKEWRKTCDKQPARRQRMLDIAEGGTWKAAQRLVAEGAAR